MKAGASLVLLSVSLASGCATRVQMQMPPDELKDLQAHEGVVLGSVHIKGGKDVIGRTKWWLTVKRTSERGPEYSLQAHRDGEEEFFATRMERGRYVVADIRQEGFSTFTAYTNIEFEVAPGKTKYLGRLVIEFPNQYLSVGTRFRITVEDAREGALEKLPGQPGLGDAVTDLMAVRSPVGCLTGDAKRAPQSQSVALGVMNLLCQ